MRIFDCTTYYSEDMMLDVRFNILNEHIYKFIVVESKFSHSGVKKKLNFDINNFKKFKDKIIYLIYEQESLEIEKVNPDDNEGEKSRKYILNAIHRENGQRNFIKKGLNIASDEDFILISDVDEIPNLSDLNLQEIDEKIILFKQDMFYYKFNLHLPNLIWTGTKACKKKHLVNPQWLRNIKDRKYSFFRIDTFFKGTDNYD